MTTKKDIMTDPILKKGHKHRLKELVPVVCPSCKGNKITELGLECFDCEGEGEIYTVEENDG